MKKIYFLLLGSLIPLVSMSQTFQIDICSGGPPSITTSSVYGPMYTVATANATNRIASIYPSSQLYMISGGDITNLYFHKGTTTAAGILGGTANFKIYLKEVVDADWGTGALDWAIATTGATLVFDGNPDTIVGTDVGWKNFPLLSNFSYSGSQNLAVFMEYTNPNASTAIPWSYEYTSPCVTTANNNATKYTNNTTGTLPATLGTSNMRRPYIGFDALMSCYPVSNVSVTNITSTGGTLTWVEPAQLPAVGYEYYLSTNPTPPTLATMPTGAVTVGTTQALLASLTPSTDYYVWVRSDCGGGDFGGWTGTTFTTLCSFFTAPFLESFSTGGLPNCWDNSSSNMVTNGLWRFGTGVTGGATSNGKTAGTYAWADGSTPIVSDITLTSPLIDLSGLALPSLSFELFSNNTTSPGDNCAFRVEVYDGTAWNIVFTYMGDDPAWQTYCIPLPNNIGQTIQVRFIVDQTTAGTAFNNDILLDEVAIIEGALNAGIDGFSQVCASETALDLNSVITVNDNSGNWFYDNNPSAVNGNLFDVSLIPPGTVQVLYVVENLCNADTSVATIEVVPTPSSGTGITGATACNGQVAFLMDFLTGTANFGGTWTTTNANGQIINNAFHPDGGQFGSVQFTYTVDNGICAPVSTTVTVNLVDCTGIDENDAANISLYPNPNNGQFFVMNGGSNMTVTVEVMDMQGKVVFSKQINLTNGSREEINVDAQSGMYLVRVTNETSSLVHQVLIK